MALICLILAGWQLPSESANREDIESHSDNKHHTSVGSERLRDEDFLGGILFTITITIFLLILALGGHRLSWTDPIILSLVATCVISSTVFGMMEGFWARKPLIPLRLMRKHGIDVFCMVQILLFCARLAVSKLKFHQFSLVNCNRAVSFKYGALLRAYGKREQHLCCGLSGAFNLIQRLWGTSRRFYHR